MGQLGEIITLVVVAMILAGTTSIGFSLMFPQCTSKVCRVLKTVVILLSVIILSRIIVSALF